MSELTPKQTLFVHEYLIDLNATQAAIRAGYSEKSAKQQGTENLAKPSIKALIDEAMDSRIAKTKIDANWLLERLAEEAMADVNDLYDDNGSLLPINQWPMIWRQGLVAGMDITTEYETVDGKKEAIGLVTKMKISDRVKRLELIGKHIDVRAFDTTVQHTGKDGGPISIEDANPTEMARRMAFLLMGGADYAEH